MSVNENQIVKQAVVVSGDLDPNMTSESIALFNEDGSPIDLNSGPGGSVDLSAVDQDINVLNHHVVRFFADDGSVETTGTPVGVRDDFFGGLVVENSSGNGVYFPSPGSGWTGSWAAVIGQVGGSNLYFNEGTDRTHLRFEANHRMVTEDLRHEAGYGPILVAPDDSLHRLKVANDGSLSTEPVV